MSEALSLDALCGLAWFNNGVHECSKKEFKGGMISFLIAALVQPNDVESWSNCMICSFNLVEFQNLSPSILAVAYDKNGERFFSKFADEIEKQPNLSEWRKTQIVNLIGEYLRDLKKKEKLPILRLIKPDGTYTVIDSNLESIKEVLDELAYPEFPKIP